MEKDKAKKSQKKKEKQDKEVCEIFEVEKNGKTETVESCGTEKDKPLTEKQINEENKILRNVLIGISILVIIIIAGYFFINSLRHFEYNGVKFEIVKEGKLILYQTSLPVTYQGALTEYNFYLRNDPRQLEKVPFNGNLIFTKNAVINSTEWLNCDGDGVIAIANLVNLYNVLGINYMKDDNASCDAQGRYTYINIQNSTSTGIEKFGPVCYNININNCEILEGMERFMVENFIKINENLRA